MNLKCACCGGSMAHPLCAMCARDPLGPRGNVGNGPTDIQRAEARVIEAAEAWVDWMGNATTRTVAATVEALRLARKGEGA